MTVKIAGAFFLLLLLCACGGGPPERASSDAPSGYKEVSDAELFAAVERLPDVTTSSLRYVDELGQSNTYRGDVDVRPGMSKKQLAETFDEVARILRHGHWKATIDDVTIFSGQAAFGAVNLDIFGSDDLQNRYGPQTGEKGWPPPFVPN